MFFYTTSSFMWYSLSSISGPSFQVPCQMFLSGFVYSSANVTNK